MWTPLLALALFAPPMTVTCPPGAEMKSAPREGGFSAWCEVEGLRVGPFSRWHPDGTIAAAGHAVAGRRDGDYFSRYPGGKPHQEGRYQAGQRVGVWRLWDPGGWRREGPLVADRPEGEWAVFDAADQRRAAGPYVAGARHGRWAWLVDGETHHGSYDRGRFLMCDGRCPLLQPQIELEEALRGIEGPVRACYRKAQASDPKLAGDLELRWEMDATGEASQVEQVGGSLPVGPLTACVIDHVAKLRLPAPGKPVPGRRVFRFRPESGFTDDLSTLGHCQAKALRPALNPARAALTRCVKAGQAWPPAQGGFVELRWRIGPDGQVTGISVQPEDDGARVACLAGQIEPLRFPAGAACQVTYTLRWE